MTEIKYDKLTTKITSLVSDKLFLNSKFISYDGDNIENFAAVMLATFKKKKTFVIGNNSSINPKLLMRIADVDIGEKNTVDKFRDIIQEIQRNKSLNDIALITNTSGTTSTPKSVEFSYKNLIEKVLQIIKIYKVNEKSRELVILPFKSSAVLFEQLMPVLFSRGTLEYTGLPLNFVKIIKRMQDQFDFSGMTPTILRVLEKFQLDWNNVGIKNIAIGGEQIDFDLLQNINRNVGREVLFPMYGMSELGGAVAGIPGDENRPQESIGKLFPGINARVSKDGELCIKDPNCFNGYLTEEGTELIHDQKKWLKTGDIAEMDDLGYLYVRGRKKNIIISGGVNIYPEEIENFINKCPNVLGSRIKKEKDDALGEIMVAMIAVKNQETFNLERLKETLKEHIEPLKMPRKWEITEEIKLIGLGKAKVE